MTNTLIMLVCTMAIRFFGFYIGNLISKSEDKKNSLNDASLCLLIIFLLIQLKKLEDIYLVFAAGLTIIFTQIFGGMQLPILMGLALIVVLRNF